jgi:hypothetical protein
LTSEVRWPDAKAGRDHKPGDKPPGWWKRLRRQQRRAAEQRALPKLGAGGGEIPLFKHTDQWDWL